MYDPLLRLGRFVDDAETVTPVVEHIAPIVTRVRKPKSKKHTSLVVVHVVSVEQLREELEQPPHNAFIASLCKVLEQKRVMTARYTAKNSKQATSLAASFGTGNLLVYILATSNVTVPKYLAVGVTTGCTIDELQLVGTWDVLHVCNMSQHKVNDMQELCWDIYPSVCVHLRPCFVRAYLPKVWDVYAEIAAERSAGSSNREIIAKDPMARRSVLLIEWLFSLSEVSKRSFYQTVPGVQ